MFASKIYEVFKNEPEKAQVLFQFAENIERNLEIIFHNATKQDIELAKKELEYQIKQLESKTLIQIKELEGKIETTKIELEAKIKELEIKIEKSKSTLLKWSFLFWITQLSVMIGFFYTFLKTIQKQ